MSVYDKYEMTIGIECHVQLATKTKLFSSADNDSRFAQPNENVTPVDYGLPGMLPVLNREAVVLAIRAGKALDSEIALESRFDRKHYFYPDLPKGYQTTQMYYPIIGAGIVEAPLEGGSTVRVRIHHAHMEEDAGKLTHSDGYSLVDLNRAGTPLIEIVSEPDIHSAQEARAFATELYRRMTYAGVTHGDLYHGNMRFDVNISVAKKGEKVLGKRAEVKNLNSFRSVERASEYEFKRQVDILERGEQVVQETRGWNDDKQVTTSQRSKEDAQDYRYMPDADIPPIVLTEQDIDSAVKDFPLMPAQYRENWKPLNLDISVVEATLEHQPVARLVNALVEQYGAGELVRRVFNWFASSQATDIDTEAIKSGLVESKRLAELSEMVGANKLSSTGAKEIFIALFKPENAQKSAADIAKSKNLLQLSDEGAIERIVDEVLAEDASQKAIADIKSGNEKAIGYLVGQIMKRSKGQANPAMATGIVKRKLSQ